MKLNFCEQYKYSINYHTTIIKTLSDGLKVANKIIAKADIIAKIAIAISLFMILLLNLKNFVALFNALGVSSLFFGVICILLKVFINQFFNFEILLVVSKALTDLLEFILNSIYDKLLLNGIWFTVMGVFLIIVGSYLQAKKSKDND